PLADEDVGDAAVAKVGSLAVGTLLVDHEALRRARASFSWVLRVPRAVGRFVDDPATDFARRLRLPRKRVARVDLQREQPWRARRIVGGLDPAGNAADARAELDAFRRLAGQCQIALLAEELRPINLGDAVVRLDPVDHSDLDILRPRVSWRCGGSGQ